MMEMALEFQRGHHGNNYVARYSLDCEWVW